MAPHRLRRGLFQDDRPERSGHDARHRLDRRGMATGDAGTPLPDAYHRLFRWWVAFGFPAFGAVLAILWLMLTKPATLI